MKDWVINLTVVLADGSVIKTRRRPRKTSAGYNLTNLFVGSEGTLGFVTEVTLKLAVIPQETSVAVVTFPTIRDAAAAASKIMRAGVPVAAMELMDEVQMSVINRTQATKKTWKEMPTMFFKYVQKCTSDQIKLTILDFPVLKLASRRTYLWSRILRSGTKLATSSSPPVPKISTPSGPLERKHFGVCSPCGKPERTCGLQMLQFPFLVFRTS